MAYGKLLNSCSVVTSFHCAIFLFTPAYLDIEHRLQDVIQYINSKAGVVVHLDVMQNDVI
jgi:hypothetical protein